MTHGSLKCGEWRFPLYGGSDKGLEYIERFPLYEGTGVPSIWRS